MVDFKLTEDQLEMQNLFRKFAQEQILPIAEEMDEKEVSVRKSVAQAWII